jgi:starch phosphorylase
LATANTIGPFLGRTRLAYFSMEIALHPDIHTYSGGLGILAGDTARSSADLELPMAFVTLLSRQGYMRQTISASGVQSEHPDPWNPPAYATPLRAKVAVTIGGREIWVRPWLHTLRGVVGHTVPVLLLDTDLDENHPDDRNITDTLYGGDQVYRLKQEIVLGIGGVRALQALGFGIQRYHLNEGHAALLALDLLRRHPRPADQVRPGEIMYDVGRVRQSCVFTTHTPVEAGHDRFDYDLVSELLGGYIDMEQLKLLAGRDRMNMTHLALQLSGYVNGVATRHAETTTRMFPGYRIRAVTNGIHVGTWAHRDFAAMYNQHFSAWAYEPEVMVRADQLPDTEVWDAHARAKQDLIDLVRAQSGCSFDPGLPTIGFARRMTAYKRPELLFSDLTKLAAINDKHPFQVVLAGKAHPNDAAGKQHIEAIHRHVEMLKGRIPVCYLAGYDMTLAKTLVSGVDIWLNTPVPPMEASGTSGMKAALNGVLNLSVLDGWWLEAWIEGVTGWAIGEDGAAQSSAEHLYEKLQNTVLPLYYTDRARWIWMMKQAISKIACYFNTQRMMRRYAAEAYLL